MLPVGDPGQEDLVEVAQHGRERLGLLGRAVGQRGADLARLDLGEHGQLADALEVVRGPLDGGVAVGAQVRQRPRSAWNRLAHAASSRPSRSGSRRRSAGRCSA